MFGLKFERIRIIPLLIIVGIFGLMARVGLESSALSGDPQGVPTEGGITSGIGEMLFNEFLAPFEIIDVLLVAALIGGVYLAKRSEGVRDEIEKAIETEPRIEAEEAEESMGEVKTDGSG